MIIVVLSNWGHSVIWWLNIIVKSPENRRISQSRKYQYWSHSWEQKCSASGFIISARMHVSVTSSATDEVLPAGRVERCTESTERMTTSCLGNWITWLIGKQNSFFFFSPCEEFAVYFVDWIILSQRTVCLRESSCGLQQRGEFHLLSSLYFLT